MKDYQPGQLIRVKGVNNRRLAALALAALGVAFGLSRTGTTIITHNPKPAFGPKIPTPHSGSHPGGGPVKGGGW
jgi:hypothetical protein